MSGGKGGSQTSSVNIPDWIKGPAERNLARAETAAQIGYMPYYGPDVAAFSPQQEAAQNMAFGAGQAYGLIPASQKFSTGMPEAQTFDGGIRGYSSGGLFDQAVNELATRRPEQVAKYNSLYDPNSVWNDMEQWNARTAAGTNPYVSTYGTAVGEGPGVATGPNPGQAPAPVTGYDLGGYGDGFGGGFGFGGGGGVDGGGYDGGASM